MMESGPILIKGWDEEEGSEMENLPNGTAARNKSNLSISPKPYKVFITRS